MGHGHQVHMGCSGSDLESWQWGTVSQDRGFLDVGCSHLGQGSSGPCCCPKMMGATCNQTCGYGDSGLTGKSRHLVNCWRSVDGLQSTSGQSEGRSWVLGDG